MLQITTKANKVGLVRIGQVAVVAWVILSAVRGGAAATATTAAFVVHHGCNTMVPGVGMVGKMTFVSSTRGAGGRADPRRHHPQGGPVMDRRMPANNKNHYYYAAASAAARQEADRTPDSKAEDKKPFAVIVQADIEPSRLDEFLQLIEVNAQQTRLEPDCLRFDVLRSQTNPNQFFFYELYRTADAMEYHKQQPHYQLWANFKANGGTVSSVTYKTDGEFLT